MEHIIRRYLKKKFPLRKGITVEMFLIHENKGSCGVKYSYRTGGIFSKERLIDFEDITVWDMIEYLYYSADGRIH